MKQIVVEYIQATAEKGANLHNAITAAAIMALTENRIVHLDFNSITYLVDPITIVEQLLDPVRNIKGRETT